MSEAHASLANIQFYYEWNWQAAHLSYRRAIELNGNSADARWFYGMSLAATGRYDEAVAEGKRALELDPLSVLTNVQVGWIYWLADRMDDVMALSRKLIEFEPRAFGAYWLMGGAYLANEMPDEAIASYRKSLSLGGGRIVLSVLGRVCAMLGRREEALAILDQLLELKQHRYVPAFDNARVYLGLGDVELTFEWLEKAFEERNGELVFLERITRLEPGESSEERIREDPRFSSLLERAFCFLPSAFCLLLSAFC